MTTPVFKDRPLYLDDEYLAAIQYTTDQSVDDPVWESDQTILEMGNTDDPNDEKEETASGGVRTIFGGALDFLNKVEEEIEEVLQHDSVPEKVASLPPIKTKTSPSDNWRGSTLRVNTQVSNLLNEAPRRRKVTLVNYGPSIVYISALPINVQDLTLLPTPNCVSLPVSSATFWAPITLTCKEAIYAICASATGRVEAIEEFDMEC